MKERRLKIVSLKFNFKKGSISGLFSVLWHIAIIHDNLLLARVIAEMQKIQQGLFWAKKSILER